MSSRLVVSARIAIISLATVRIDVETGEAAALLGCQLVGIGLINAELLQPAQHARGELALALLVGWTKCVKEFFIILH
jgi:hypothetical protein